MSSVIQDPQRALLALSDRQVRLELETFDLCLLAALVARGEHAELAAFSEQQLIEVFEQVNALLSSSESTPSNRRAAPTIRRLREQRLLSRVDGAGVLRSGEYSLSRLATSIVEFYLEDQALSQESLTLLTRTLTENLKSLATHAATASGEEAWQKQVIAPLRVTISDLLDGIERRQRGFDLEQESLKGQIAELIQSDWFGAIEQCQALLETTSQTLRELNQVLLRDTHEIQALLQDICEGALDAGNTDAEAITRSVMDHIDRIAAWGSARQRAWSEYYQYVHRYLRDVVRLDPSRMLVHRLREQLAGRSGRRFALAVAQAPSMRLLRPMLPPAEPPPVRRPRKQRDAELDPAAETDVEAELELEVRAALEHGASALSEVTAEVTAELAPDQRFAVTGKVAQIAARLCRPPLLTERPWVAVGEDMLIEDWPALGARGQR